MKTEQQELELFGEVYKYIAERKGLDSVIRRLSKEAVKQFRDITAAMVIDNQGEYIEIWLTDSETPNRSGTTFIKVYHQ